MKINIHQITPEILTLEEEVSPKILDLDTDLVKFRKPLNIKAEVTKITNALTVELTLHTRVYMECSRCLNEFEIDFKKNLRLSYSLNKSDREIDLSPDIRDQIILDYPINPLCSPDCKGLCPNCGKNLNEGGCSCAITKKKTFEGAR